MLPVKEAEAGAGGGAEDCGACRQCDTCCDSCCCSFWSYVLVILFLIGGFSGEHSDIERALGLNEFDLFKVES